LDILAEYATAFWERARADDDFAAELMFRHGVPADTVAITQRVASIARNWGADFETTRFLRASSTIELRDRSLRVIHAPGHSPTDTLFFDEMHGVLFSGDHLLAGTSSSALASLPAEANGARCQRSHRQGLVEYIDSLRVTRELNASVVLGGHGGPFSEHRALIDSRLAHYEAQAEVILSLVREQPRTAYQIAKVIWGNVAVTQAFFTLSQVLGHIDVLTIDGLIAEQPHSSESIIYMAV
jgi:glyoxylase-like metal-dependent hydrolase (beta-lactamase superfamily II)